MLKYEPETLGYIELYQIVNGNGCRYFITEKLSLLNGILYSRRFSYQRHKFSPFDPLLPHFVAVGRFDGWLGSVHAGVGRWWLFLCAPAYLQN